MNASQAVGRWRSWIHNQPLRRKLKLLGLATAITAGLIASVVLLAHRLYVLRNDYLADTLSITRIVAENAVGPVAFQDATAASTVLATLRAKPVIRGATIDLPGKKNFASFGEPLSEPARLREGKNAEFRGWMLYTAAPISDSATGTVYLVADLRPVLWDTVRAFAYAVIGGVALALVLSLVLNARLQRFILEPVDNLHRAAHHVAETATLRQRAEVLGQDEIGQLTATFNRMLDRIEANDAALRSANDELNAEIVNRQRLEGKLLETSRLAGMAQVATGVLHNVGNVLNSVNISANILRDSLRSNPHFALLGQTTALLQSQGENLERFITQDPRGKLVPPFFAKLGEQIALVHRDLLLETEQLSTNIDHIKQIVALQQNYARGGGVITSVKPADLFSDALRIAHASITRHGVAITREFSATPEIVTDRHQVMQILVNFLTNAVQAVKPREGGDRRVRVATTTNGEMIEFVVEDNGIGIAPENLQRIFQHGFTTRKDGHGFGLHSGALAARNLDGQLTAHSDGPDRGARFTLTLPKAVRQKQDAA